MNQDQQLEIIAELPPYIVKSYGFNKELDSWIEDMDHIGLTFDDMINGIMALNAWRDRKKEQGDNPKLNPTHYTKAIRRAFRDRTGTPDIKELITNTTKGWD